MILDGTAESPVSLPTEERPTSWSFASGTAPPSPSNDLSENQIVPIRSPLTNNYSYAASPRSDKPSGKITYLITYLNLT